MVVQGECGIEVRKWCDDLGLVWEAQLDLHVCDLSSFLRFCIFFFGNLGVGGEAFVLAVGFEAREVLFGVVDGGFVVVVVVALAGGMGGVG